MMDLDSSDFWETLKKKVDNATSIQIRGNDQLITDLKQALCSDFPNIPIYPFGSRIMGVADADSDLDIFLDAGGNDIYIEQPTVKVLENQRKIANSMKRSSENWTFIQTLGGMCPLVIVRHVASGIKCDISFSKKISSDQNVLVNHIFDLQPIARYMVIYLRGWAQKYNCTAFRGHILILMVIFFLQIRGKLPSIYDLQSGLSPNFGPWKSGFKKLGLSSFNMNQIALGAQETRNILKDFFSYYSKFNYAQLVICPWLGKEIWRSMMKSHMPPGSQCFHDLVVTSNRAVIIQDIMHLNQNKGYAINQQDLSSFKMKCNVNI